MDTPEQARIAAEAKVKADAEWAADVREKQGQRMRVLDAARNPRELEQQMGAAGSELAKARAESGQINPADHEARLVAAEAVARAAKTAFDIVQVRAQAAQVRALGDAGSDPTARAKAVAKAQSDWAEAVGGAESAHEAASIDLDRTAVDALRAKKIADHRSEAAKARMVERAKGESDPMRLSNPFADPIRPVITASQFDSIRDPALRARAAQEADIVPDDDPPFTKDDAANVLRSRGSTNRSVMARSEFDALSPVDRATAARQAIILD